MYLGRAETVLAVPGIEELKHSCYSDLDERMEDTIEAYVESLLRDDDAEPMRAGDEFTVDHCFYRSERWRVIAVNPITVQLWDPQPTPEFLSQPLNEGDGT